MSSPDVVIWLVICIPSQSLGIQNGWMISGALIHILTVLFVLTNSHDILVFTST
jgi:hypothetical protein